MKGLKVFGLAFFLALGFLGMPNTAQASWDHDCLKHFWEDHPEEQAHAESCVDHCDAIVDHDQFHQCVMHCITDETFVQKVESCHSF
jgi:hypothetical protein